jgi:hypothetical protein
MLVLPDLQYTLVTVLRSGGVSDRFRRRPLDFASCQKRVSCLI